MVSGFVPIIPALRRGLFAVVAALTMAVAPAVGQNVDQTDRIDRLYDALNLDDIIALMREEGIDAGRGMGETMFPGDAGAGWDRILQGIYDEDAMRTLLRDRFDPALAEADLAPILAFFTSDTGRRIVAMEISAREVMLDPSVEEEAADRAMDMRRSGDPRFALLRGFSEANDLIASNVEGALNSSYAFYTGLTEGGSGLDSLTTGSIIGEVWAQEDAIWEDTERWVYAYLALAFGPLEDAELEDYIAFSRTEAGQALNRALFDGFDHMFDALSLRLGRAAAGFMFGRKI